jgi:hypothetical protein
MGLIEKTTHNATCDRCGYPGLDPQPGDYYYPNAGEVTPDALTALGWRDLPQNVVLYNVAGARCENVIKPGLLCPMCARALVVALSRDGSWQQAFAEEIADHHHPDDAAALYEHQTGEQLECSHPDLRSNIVEDTLVRECRRCGEVVERSGARSYGTPDQD